ncbi:hypothetical protein BGZ79_000833 [Entomortierella chlamydospora]|nr:hypothetical protein BGZ79_000833 [Entomortierella chlamydospora]
MASPSYTGATDSLPEGIESAPYFKTTKVAEWSLQGFLTATGKDEKSFLSEILDLSKFKPVPLDVRLFAKGLYNFYNGIFGEEVTAIAKDQAQSSINRSNRGVGSATQSKRAKPASELPNIFQNKVGRIVEVKNNLPNPFVEEEVSSSPSTWTLSSRLKGNRTAAGAKKKLDIAETSEENVQSPELFVDTEDVENDEMAQFESNTNDDAYSEDHTMYNVSANDKEASLVHFKMLNQDTEWVYEGMDMAKKFHEFRSRNCQSFSFARDWIADLTPGSQFEQALPSHIKPVANLVELSTINVSEGPYWQLYSGEFSHQTATTRSC